MMCTNPIVKETRKAGKELAKKATYDIHTFFENLRKKEKEEKRKIVSRAIERPLAQAK